MKAVTARRWGERPREPGLELEPDRSVVPGLALTGSDSNRNRAGTIQGDEPSAATPPGGTAPKLVGLSWTGPDAPPPPDLRKLPRRTGFQAKRIALRQIGGLCQKTFGGPCRRTLLLFCHKSSGLSSWQGHPPTAASRLDRSCVRRTSRAQGAVCGCAPGQKTPPTALIINDCSFI